MNEKQEKTVFYRRKNFKRLFHLIVERVNEADISNSAVVIAYYLLLSIFPLLIVLGNLLPYLSFEVNEVMGYLATIVPENIYSALEGTLRSLLTNSSGSLLSFGAIGALWSASRSMNALQNGMNKAYGVDGRLNFIVVRIASLLFMLALILGVLVVVLVFSFGQQALSFVAQHIDISGNIITAFTSLKWPLTIVILIAVFVLLYYLVPNVKLSLRSTLPGALFATTGWIVISQGFAFYVSEFASRTISYGSVGVFIVLMLWLYLAGYVITLGAVINAVIHEYRNGSDKEIGQIEKIVGKTIGKGKRIINNRKEKIVSKKQEKNEQLMIEQEGE
ncbi:YihY/virulence factor BrkB family protein [Isobaculum melis]|uniref:Membrane protein n=1 Tax=Isobaculum melis TaxID=142588 RepID=A0A1H9TYT0_9LACT|nr:YihY/virulence factor BrkB family protein [Isobaculum melis]SES02269.1 membrane protein [Isobaculum melis]